MMMLNKIKCEKCGKCTDDKVLICKIGNFWMCGECIHEYKMKQHAQLKKLMLEG